MRRALASLVLLWAGGCGGGTVDVCAVKLQRLTGLEAARIHGLTQADDPREATERVTDAFSCAGPAQVPVVLSHARLLAMRLEARGATAELLNLARALGNSPQCEELRAQAARGGTAATSRLEAHARLLQREDPGPRSSAAAQAWANVPFVAPEKTRAQVMDVSAVESCVVLWPGANAPDGTVLLRLKRGTAELPLYGGSTALTWSAQRKVPTRVCVAGALQDGDVLLLSMDGQVVESFGLPVTSEALALGALRSRVAHPFACAKVAFPDARDACELMAGATP